MEPEAHAGLDWQCVAAMWHATSVNRSALRLRSGSEQRAPRCRLARRVGSAEGFDRARRLWDASRKPAGCFRVATARIATWHSPWPRSLVMSRWFDGCSTRAKVPIDTTWSGAIPIRRPCIRPLAPAIANSSDYWWNEVRDSLGRISCGRLIRPTGRDTQAGQKSRPICGARWAATRWAARRNK